MVISDFHNLNNFKREIMKFKEENIEVNEIYDKMCKEILVIVRSISRKYDLIYTYIIKRR
jgi:hypothetical protein